MAATDKVQIFFTKDGSRFWTNVYHVNALTLDAAAAWANIVLAGAMTNQLCDVFHVAKTVVDHLADDTFVSTPLNLVGEVTETEILPLFNTVKVDIAVAGNGRNDGKFIRGWLRESVMTDGAIASAALSAFDDIFSGLIADSTAAGVDLCDADGNLWLTATCRPAIQERQLHRRRKKVVAP